jgi:hypothetical protein
MILFCFQIYDNPRMSLWENVMAEDGEEACFGCWHVGCDKLIGRKMRFYWMFENSFLFFRNFDDFELNDRNDG